MYRQEALNRNGIDRKISSVILFNSLEELEENGSVKATTENHLRHRVKQKMKRNVVDLVRMTTWVFASAVCLATLLSTASATEELEVVVDSKAAIPCNLKIDENVRKVLVVIHRIGVSKAIYSYSTSTGLENAKHTVDGEYLGDRAQFEPFMNPPSLTLSNVTLRDESDYTCFIKVGRNSETTSSNLTVIVPPDQPTVLNTAGQPVDLDNVTYNEGDSVDLTCQVTGGKPSPRVSWHWDKDELDTSHDASGTNVVRNRLLLGPLTRQHGNARLICHAFNHPLVHPKNTAFKLIVQYKPSSVEIVSDNVPMKSGETYRIQCRSIGAQPPAVITWWLDGVQLTNATHRIYEQMPEGEDMTLSTLVFQPVVQDRKKVLQCQAKSPVIHHKPLIDERLLAIHYMGSVRLNITNLLRDQAVVEGTSVRLSCNVDSDPPPRIISWYHKVGDNQHKLNVQDEVTLLIPNVSRNDSGVYSCIASNGVEYGHSNPLMVSVHYKPTCVISGVQMIGTGINEEVGLDCRVNSFPDATSYSFKLNSSGNIRDLPENSFRINDQGALLHYIPKKESDYGSILCWGENSVGQQEKPCRFELISAVQPSPLTNCTASKNETHKVMIECIGGTERGLPETYVIEVYDSLKDRLLRNVSNNEPFFLVDELDPGSGYLIEAYTSNIRGPSEKFSFRAFTQPILKKSADFTTIHVFPITPILGVLVGIVGAVVLMAIVVVVIMKLKSSKSSHGTKLKCGEPAILPFSEKNFSHKSGKGKGKQTLINFPAEPLPPKATKAIPEEVFTAPAHSVPSAPPPEVEYAELEFVTDKKAKKKHKKDKTKKKKQREMKDEETEYATIDHVKTLQNSQQRQMMKTTVEEEDEDLGAKQPLIKIDDAVVAQENGAKSYLQDSNDEKRDCIVLPDGSLESSV